MGFSHNNRSSRRKIHRQFEALEPRQMMSATPLLEGISSAGKGINYDFGNVVAVSTPSIPALSSLPGAAKSIFLDFDGDFQAVWNRTDSGQTYRNVNAQASNLSEADIRKVWETVAEDFAPFNVNVTTVQPASFADNVALRVVIAGDMTAQLVTGPNSTVALSGDRFITNDSGRTLLDTSGYAAIDSFTNSEPNVVYVFGKYMSTWGTTSPEGHARSLAALVANTASHEAGHAFGLVHHEGVNASGNASNYHVGSSVTTPIMGDNTAGDRTLWSVYTEGSTTYDSIQRLTSTLGARPDDHPSGTWFARPLSFTSTSKFSSQSTIAGIIEKTSDQDWFRFSTSGASVSINLKTVEFANLDARLEVYKVVPTWFGSSTSLIASVDGPILFGAPFSGLGASYNASLAAGDYMVAIKSHGGYGDLGNYTLTVGQNTLYAGGSVIGVKQLSTASTTSTSSTTSSTTLATSSMSGGQGQGMTSDPQRISAVDAVFDALGRTTRMEQLSWMPTAKKRDVAPAIGWTNFGSSNSPLSARIVDRAFSM